MHSRYHTPYVAISLAGALGVAFVLTRTFEQLADTFVLSIWPFYGLAVAGLYRLRRRPDLPRPYKVPGYPVLPAVFIAGVVYLVGNALVTDPLWTSVTFAIVLAGIPVYYVFFASKQNTYGTQGSKTDLCVTSSRCPLPPCDLHLPRCHSHSARDFDRVRRSSPR